MPRPLAAVVAALALLAVVGACHAEKPPAVVQGAPAPVPAPAPISAATPQPVGAPLCGSEPCPPGQRCKLVQVQCIRAPCPPIPQCVPVDAATAGSEKR